MSEMGTYEAGQAPDTKDSGDAEHTPAECAEVAKIQKIIKADKKHFERAFKRMRRDMFVAMHGREETWSETKYTANICGRHVKQKTAALYAKNPKVTAKRRETLDFAVWDEDPQSLMLAQQTMQQAMTLQATAASMPPEVDPATGAEMPVQPPVDPMLMQAQAVIADFTAGMARRQEIQKTGKTLEILFAQAMREQKPVDFKTGMKMCVRRATTTSVGYVELGFQREYGPRPGLTEQLADQRQRLDHLQALIREAGEGDIEADDAEMEELQRSTAAIQAEPEIILREGLIFDFPQSTKVIPDRLCRSIVGFIGCRHVTVEYLYTKDEVEELFGVDLKEGYSGYKADGKANDEPSAVNMVREDDEEDGTTAQKDAGMVCVWKFYDKPSGLVTIVADGYKYYLRAPASPDVFVEDFWPVYALTFNATESESDPYPPSDVALLLPMQREWNRSREGKRLHRKAALPRWVASKGTIDNDDAELLADLAPFGVAFLNKDAQTKLSDVLETIPIPGVDPNLYDTGEIMTDIQLVGGTQESSYGGVAQATATESAIAANSTQSNDGSSIDDLDAFLTVIARAGGQILLKEMTAEKVTEIVGPGAVWPQMTLEQIASEVFLEVEAGSSGKPNQAVEIQNFKDLVPLLLQVPGMKPEFLAREGIRRMDDRLDLTDALAPGVPSIVNQNRMAQAGTGDPATDPAAQGGEGGANGPQPPGQTGSGPAFGSNQV